MRALVALVLLFGCAKKKRDEAVPPPPVSIDAISIDAPALRPDPRIAPETPAMADGIEMPPACAELRKLLAKVATCEKVPQETREMLLSSFSQLDEAFTAAGSDTRASLATSCQSAVDGIKESAMLLCDQ